MLEFIQLSEMETMGAGARIAVQYHADPTLWHERIVLCHLGGSQFLLLTPDFDLTSENIGGSGEIKAARVVRPDRSVRGINRNDLYLFEDQQGNPDGVASA